MEMVRKLVQEYLENEAYYKGKEVQDVNELTEEELFSKYWEFIDGCNSDIIENFTGLVVALLKEGFAEVSLSNPNILIPSFEAELGADTVIYNEDAKRFELVADINIESRPQLIFLLSEE